MQHNTSSRKGIAIIGVLFFIFGAITWLNATLIPYLKVACELNNFQSYFVAFAFYISYFVMALPSAAILRRTGLKNGMTLGLVVMAAGALLFIPAALMRTYPLFLLGLFVMGTGLALLQTASNPYVIELGPMESAAQRMSVMGICNKVAGILSPLALGAIVLSNIDAVEATVAALIGAAREAELNALAQKVAAPYAVIVLLLLGMGMFVKYSALPEVKAEDTDESNSAEGYNLLCYPRFWFGVVALFCYVGVEVIAVDSIILYGVQQGFSLAQAKAFSTFPLLCMVAGYLLSIIAIPKFVSQERALAACCLLGVAFTIGALSTWGATAIAMVALLGFAHSIMWPAIFPMAIRGLGRHTEQGSAVLIMAIAGGAILPLLYGRCADAVGNQSAYWMMIPCYLVILVFALTGVKKKYN